MITVRIIGGLGNQMFQYAAGKALAKHHGVECKLDVSAFKNYKIHGYGLSNLSISSLEVGMNIFEKIKLFLSRKIYRESSFSFNPHFFELPEGSYLTGYFQSEKYFAGVEGVLRKEFVPREKISDEAGKILKSIESSPSVSLHIRRGDYVTNSQANAFHGTCGLDYYQKCIGRIEAQIKNPHFFIFSDDLAWVRKNLKISHPIFFVEGLSGIEDMFLMSQCKHNIIANSTFSWWGAWLNQNSDKMVFAPQKWFTDTRINDKDLIPQGWIRL